MECKLHVSYSEFIVYSHDASFQAAWMKNS